MSSIPQQSEPKLKPVNSISRRFPTFRSVMALMMREMSTTYGKSMGGYVWIIIEPVAGIILLTALFSAVLRTPPIGVNFAIFYATGMVPFMYYNGLANKIAQAIQFSRPLLVYPAVTLIDALIARAIVTCLTGLLVGYVIFFSIMTLNETRTNPQLLLIGQSYLMATAFGLGVGTMNSFLFARFPSWQTIWAVINRPMLLISCVINIYDDVPHPYDQILWWNPIVHIVGEMRRGFYLNYPGQYVSPTYVYTVSFVLITVGLALLLRYHRRILYEW